MNKIIRYLTAPVSNITVVLFRIVFGTIIFAEGAGALATGWVKDIFLTSEYSFTLIGFDFLLLLLNEWMYVHYCLIALCGAFIAMGLYYRASLLLYLMLWFIAYAMQKHHYNNHYYLMILLGFLMIFVPAHKRLSLDVKLEKTKAEYYCPSWCIHIFILQFAIVYFYAAVAKLYPDWLAGKPLSIWLAYKPMVAGLVKYSFFIPLLSHGGILFDFFIVPLLLIRRTRMTGVALSLTFHLFNSIVFQIGTFPYLMIGALILFFPPGEVESRLKLHRDENAKPELNRITCPVASVLIIYFLFQTLLPLRHHLYPGDVNWTEEGHRLSWRMMLHTKSGSVTFKVRDNETQREWMVEPVNEGINYKQKAVMAKAPDMIWQYSQYLKERLEEKGFRNVAIYCHSEVSLNGGPVRPFTDTTADLTTIKWKPFETSAWIIKYDKE